MVVFVICLIILVLLIILHFVFTRNHKDIKRAFKKSNVIVFGKKGTGKDLVFQWIIRKRSKDKYNHYWSNISYGYHYHNIKLKDISCSPNTFDNFINDNVKPCDYCLYEKEDVYISDLGIYLPSQYDSLLHKKYPSLPIYYALSRHLANHNIHCNVQNIERGWKAIREQADYFINTKKTFRIFNLLITCGFTYDKYSSALSGMLPYKRGFIEKPEERALRKQYYSTYGEIQKFTIIQRIKSVKYNTRAFRPIVYNDLPVHDRIKEQKAIKKNIISNHKLFRKNQRKLKKCSYWFM